MAPRVFTKCVAVVVAYLHTQNCTIFLYFDDWLTAARNCELLSDQIHETICSCNELGLMVNFVEHSIYQHCPWFCLWKGFLPSDRAKNIKAMVLSCFRERWQSVRAIQWLLGLMASTTAVVLLNRLRMRDLQVWFARKYNPDSPPRSAVFKYWGWWSGPCIGDYRMPICFQGSTMASGSLVTLTTDASLEGGGTLSGVFSAVQMAFHTIKTSY